MFGRGNAGPAPGTYSVNGSGDKNKFKMAPRFSFAGGSRFGSPDSPHKPQPGPGAYNPSDPMHAADPKVGFGTSVRGKILASQANPGPGAYENKMVIGMAGRMYTV